MSKQNIAKKQKPVVRLNVKEFMKAQIDNDISSDKEVAERIGVSVTQIWRAKLPITDPRHNAPGGTFIAGTLLLFKGPFERFFFLDQVDARSQQTGKEVNAGCGSNAVSN